MDREEEEVDLSREGGKKEDMTGKEGPELLMRTHWTS